MKNYKELIIWKKGIEIVKRIYLLVKKFPSKEKYNTVSQITRAAVSVTANIAEGSSRQSDKDYSRFLQIALGSLFEIQTYLIIAQELNWIKKNDGEEIKMIHRFINTFNASSNS